VSTQSSWITTTLLAYAELRLGNLARAEALLDESVRFDQDLLGRNQAGYRPAYDLARVHAIRGDTEAALLWLERTIELGWALVYTWS